MKKSLIMFCIVAFVSTFAFANDITDDNKKEIKVAELPMEVSKSFGSSDKASWSLDQIFEVAPKEEGKNATYEFHVSNAEEKAIIVYDIEGNLVPEEEEKEKE